MGATNPPPFTTRYPGGEGSPAGQSRVPAEEAVLQSSHAAPSKRNPTFALVTLLSAGQGVYRLLLIRLIYSTQDKASRKKKKKEIKKKGRSMVCALVTPVQSKHQALRVGFTLPMSGCKGTVTTHDRSGATSRLSTGGSTVRDTQ